MRKLIFVLLSFSLIMYGCTNISESKIENVKNSKEVTSSNSNGWPTFTNEEIEVAKNIVREYYKHKNLPHDIEDIKYDMTTDKDGNIYNRAFGSLSKYKNSNSIIFLVHTKDIDNCDQARLIVLTRENKDSSFKVVNEGL